MKMLRLNHLNGWLVGLICFGALIAINCSYLSNPPYWDDILGLHNQAVWLAKHHFDVVTLWSGGQSFWEGGANVYRFGIMPYFNGLLYLLLPSAYVHIFGHVFNIACLAVTFGLFFSVLRKYIAPWLALLWCIAALCEPVMGGRTAALGQECPLIMFGALAIYFIFRGQIRRALLFIVLCSLVKMTGVVIACALVCWLIAGLILPRKCFQDGVKHQYSNGLIAVTAVIAVVIFCGLTLFEVDYGFGEWSLSLRQKLFEQFPLLIPVQLLLLAVLLVTALVRGVKIYLRREPLSELDWFSFFLLIMLGGFWVSFLMYPAVLPRYTAFIVFPSCAFAALNLTNKRLNVVVVMLFIIIGGANWQGQFYSLLPGAHRRSGEYLERSREYLQDIELNRKLCHELERRSENCPIVAKWPFLQMLTMPEMGYVSSSLNLYDPGNVPLKYVSVGKFEEKRKMPPETLYVFISNSFEFWPDFGKPLMPEKGDWVFYEEKGLNGFVLVYQSENAKQAVK